MSEYNEQAVSLAIATSTLNKADAGLLDPDGDICVMARRLIRLSEANHDLKEENTKLRALVEFQHDLMTHEQRHIVVTEGFRRTPPPDTQ